MRNWSKTSSTAGEAPRIERVRVHEREVADEDRHSLAEAAGLAAPACADVTAGEVPVHRVAIATRVGPVHHVVVDERERVHELERGRRRRSPRPGRCRRCR